MFSFISFATQTKQSIALSNIHLSIPAVVIGRACVRKTEIRRSTFSDVSPKVWNGIRSDVKGAVVPHAFWLFVFYVRYEPSTLQKCFCQIAIHGLARPIIDNDKLGFVVDDAENCRSLVMEAIRLDGIIRWSTHAHDVLPESLGPETTSFRILCGMRRPKKH